MAIDAWLETNPITAGFKEVHDRVMLFAKDNADGAFAFASHISNAQTCTFQVDRRRSPKSGRRCRYLDCVVSPLIPWPLASVLLVLRKRKAVSALVGSNPGTHTSRRSKAAMPARARRGLFGPLQRRPLLDPGAAVASVKPRKNWQGRSRPATEQPKESCRANSESKRKNRPKEASKPRLLRQSALSAFELFESGSREPRTNRDLFREKEAAEPSPEPKRDAPERHRRRERGRGR
jgi:hypothetical protein